MSTKAEVRGVRREEGSAGKAGSSRGLVLYYVAALVALVGLADAVYLTVGHLTGMDMRCTITTGCNEVLGSSYASIAGIPVAGLGALAYFSAFSLATLAAFDYRWARAALAALVALMFLATLWFLYLQAFVIKHFCQYCLLSAATTITLAGIMLASRLLQRRDEGA